MHWHVVMLGIVVLLGGGCCRVLCVVKSSEQRACHGSQRGLLCRRVFVKSSAKVGYGLRVGFIHGDIASGIDGLESGPTSAKLVGTRQLRMEVCARAWHGGVCGLCAVLCGGVAVVVAVGCRALQYNAIHTVPHSTAAQYKHLAAPLHTTRLYTTPHQATPRQATPRHATPHHQRHPCHHTTPYPYPDLPPTRKTLVLSCRTQRPPNTRYPPTSTHP